MNLNHLNDPWDALKEKVEFLKDPSSYYENCSQVTHIDTHMSLIFLTNQHAYKLKKPITFSYLDFSALENRRDNCIKEIELNQYLAANIYLQLVPLMLNKEMQLVPVGHPDGEFVVDWFVKMNRFPREKTLDQSILKQDINWTLAQEAANALMSFYQASRPTCQASEAYLIKLQESIDKNEDALLNPEYGLNSALISDLHQYQRYELQALAHEIRQRTMEGRVIECHGDLRPEHICLISPPTITDRLEFNRDLRIMDAAEELAYFYLECELLGNHDVGQLFLSTYQNRLNNSPSQRLWQFYKLLRACTRAKISAWHLDDPRVNDLEKWYRRAHDYLAYASSNT
ncbi:hypothetical protein [Legionella yabuuchiae]|uniref:hypothetical protein n=1 Tax=Legionella yabuuchiae TaxID=376727 RepID=UPI001054F612|nr:hypothetical protein [Legionella yabuuchiae]